MVPRCVHGAGVEMKGTPNTLRNRTSKIVVQNGGVRKVEKSLFSIRKTMISKLRGGVPQPGPYISVMQNDGMY